MEGRIPFPVLVEFASVGDGGIAKAIHADVDRRFQADFEPPQVKLPAVKALFQKDLLLCVDAEDQELDFGRRREKLLWVKCWSEQLRRLSLGIDNPPKQLLAIVARTVSELPDAEGRIDLARVRASVMAWLGHARHANAWWLSEAMLAESLFTRRAGAPALDGGGR